MCGIAGVLSLEKPIDPKTVLRMTNRIRHRGPDDEGYIHVAESGIISELYGKDSKIRKNQSIEDIKTPAKLLLGHRRLSIIDTSPAGHQPMSYKGGKYWIVFNGEIYNYIELREQLRSKDCIFSTVTDTEVILAAYDIWGENCVRHFNGDWAFAIYDRQRGKLFLSVDRVSVKSLYYHITDDVFIFGSEIKALFASELIQKKPDLNQMMIYLFSWLHDFSEKTMFEGIYKMRPSTNITIDIKSLGIIEKKYWECFCEFRHEKYNDKKSRRYSSEIRDLLTDSVKLRLRSDVPVGTCLSGGLDSSSIVMIISGLLKKEGIQSVGERQKTFTSAYKEEKYVDESFWANKVIRESGAQGFFVYPKAEEFAQDMEDLIDCQDEPFSSTSIYAQYRVMKEASKHVKVVLDGQGADELFGGYFFYYPLFLAEGNFEDLILRKNIYGLKNIKSDVITTIKYKFFSIPMPKFFRKIVSNLYYSKKKALFLSLIEKGQTAKLPWEEISSLHRKRLKLPFNRILYHDEFIYNLQGLLRYEDRNSMKWSVESRVPFADYRLIEYVMCIPSTYKIHRGWQKWILRKAVKDIVEPSTVWRKSKLGFPTPEKEWMKIMFPHGLINTKNYDSIFWRVKNIEKILIDFPKVS